MINLCLFITNKILTVFNIHSWPSQPTLNINLLAQIKKDQLQALNFHQILEFSFSYMTLKINFETHEEEGFFLCVFFLIFICIKL